MPAAAERRILIYANAGLFCDGYILSAIGIALVTLVPAFHLSDTMTGFIGAATLLGILAGAAIFGALTDRFGRRIMMIFDLSLFVVASLLQMAAQNATELLVLRFVLGIAIGADYPIAGALIAEHMPERWRGAALNSMQVVWFLGACAAYAVGYALLGVHDSWRWILGSSAVPAVIGLVMRSAAPESPRWLQTRGTLPWPAMFNTQYRGRLAFVSAMWLLQVVPLFAIYTFAPYVLKSLHIGSPALGSIAITGAFLAGSIVALWWIESWGRRALCIFGFAVATVCFTIINQHDTRIILATFIVYAIAIGAAAGLELVYPSELFPTPIRASATGLAAAISRIGAFLGTFALPIALTRIGAAPVIWTCAALSAVGLLVALLWAPETRGVALDS